MKAKFLSILTLAAASAFSSCNMDLAPIGALDEETAIQTTNDVWMFRNFLYSTIRSFGASDFLVYSDIQTDCFNGVVINGNRMGTLANGDVLASDTDISGYWASLWYYINNANLLIEKAEPLYQQAIADNNTDDAEKLELYLGEAHFFRGYYYAMMFDRWCQVYSPALGDQPALGLPIVTVYAPTTDRSKYVGRSTMNETLKLIKDDLEAARLALIKWEDIDDSNLTSMAPYLSSYAVEAMQARLALWIGDYDTAIQKAQNIIAAKNSKGKKMFDLASIADYPKMWVDDIGDEIIFMPFEDTNELSGSIGDAWIGQMSNQADYIPGTMLITNLQNGYNQLLGFGDVRYTSFINVRKLSTNYGPVGTPCFNKFPGNPKLMTTTTPNLVNKPKIFRLSEIYLILAEASYYKGNESQANQAIRYLKQNRIKLNKTEFPDLSGNALLREIQLQRTLELVGEGFRMSDLRRWEQGFSRTYNYADIKTTGLSGVNKSQINSILTPAGLKVIYSADDHRYTWPIPSDEIDVNPQMRGQQNPGY